MAAGHASPAAGMLPPCIDLGEGVHMPRVGLGTFKARGPEAAAANEEDIAAAVAACGVPRDQLFVTSKVSPYEVESGPEQAPPDALRGPQRALIQGTDKARRACEDILQRLGGSYVDLCLVHWPGVAKTPAGSPLNAHARRETWRVLEDLYRQGRFRAIGVSNYTVAHLRELLGYAEVRPAANQVECHPRCPQPELRAFCAEQGIALVAYSPLGAGQLLEEPAVARVARETGLTPAQVLLRWGLQRGLAVIPKSARGEHIRQFDPGVLLAPAARLSEAQLAALDGLAAEEGGQQRFAWDPSRVA
eukprot:scaffold9.g3168.t1